MFLCTHQTFSPLLAANTYCNGSIPISREHLSYVISLYECFNNNTLGKLWTSSMPYLFPFIVEYRWGYRRGVKGGRGVGVQV